MAGSGDNSAVPDKALAAVCGLFCPSCSWYIATSEDPNRLARLAQRRGVAIDDARCHGCRSDKRLFYCAHCKMSACATQKGIDFCAECPEYPCEELRSFQTAAPHRAELWSSQERIRDAGWETWFAEQAAAYRCPVCSTINSTYDVKCRSCGSSPSCDFVSRHSSEISTFLERTG